MISARGVKSMDIRLFSPPVKDAWETLALVLLHWHTMGLHEVLKPLLRAEREARSESTSIYRRKVSMSGRPAGRGHAL